MCLGPGKFLPSDCRLLTQYMKPGDWTRFVLRLLLSTNSLNLEGHHFRGLYFLTLIAQTSLSLCLGSSQQNLRQKFRVCGLPKKCFLRGLGAGPGRRSCRAPAGASLYSDPQHRYGPWLGQGDQLSGVVGGLAFTLIYSTEMVLFWGEGPASCGGGPEGKGFLR